MSEPTDPAERAKSVHNEQVKLRSTLFNTVAAGFVVAGIITPIVTGLNGGAMNALPAMVVWFFLAACLHFAGIVNLERLR